LWGFCRGEGASKLSNMSFIDLVSDLKIVIDLLIRGKNVVALFRNQQTHNKFLMNEKLKCHTIGAPKALATRQYSFSQEAALN